MVSFLEYLVFFRAVFCTEQLEMTSRIDFDMFFGILIFDLKSRFCEGHSFYMMANFQNGLFSLLFGVFSSGVFAKQISSVFSSHDKKTKLFKRNISCRWNDFSVAKLFA